jgi:phosphatidate cytidylyltransferase
VLGQRILTAAILAAVFIGLLFFAPRAGWIAFCSIAIAASAWEWARLSRLPLVAALLLVAVIVVLFVAAMAGPLQAWTRGAYATAVVFWVVVAPAWLARRPAKPSRALLAAIGVLLLVTAFAALAELRDRSPALVLTVMVVVWLSDSAAYFTGRKFGRRKLAPAISPGKTWEGALGALLAVALYGVAWSFFPGSAVPPAPQPELLWLALLSVGLAVLGIIGDLFESQMKRDAGVKDSGRSLPGHGGVLDRIDALLPVLPAAVLMFAR